MRGERWSKGRREKEGAGGRRGEQEGGGGRRREEEGGGGSRREMLMMDAHLM